VPALDDVVAYTDRAGILVQIGFQRRFDVGFRAAREAVATGAIGNLLVLRAATHDPSPPAEAYIAESGGIYRDLHIHDFDAIRFVTGDEIVEIYAAGAVRETPWFERHDDFDSAAAVLRLSGGALAVLTGDPPRSARLRRPPRGVRHLGQHRRGSDARTPLRSVEPGSPPAPAGYPASWSASSAPTGPSSQCSSRRFCGAARARVRSRGEGRVARRDRGRPLAAPASPVPIEEVASAQPSQVENRH